MRLEEKRKVREKFAVQRIIKPVILDTKLLRKQLNSLSDLTKIVNNEISDNLVGAVMTLEVFEWLPKGEHVVTIKIV
jgi:hypothetical protein